MKPFFFSQNFLKSLEKFFKGLIEVMVYGTAIHLRLLVNELILIKSSQVAYQWIFFLLLQSDTINFTYDELNELLSESPQFLISSNKN